MSREAFPRHSPSRSRKAALTRRLNEELAEAQHRSDELSSTVEALLQEIQQLVCVRVCVLYRVEILHICMCMYCVGTWV